MKASSGRRYYIDDEVKAGQVYYYTVKAYAPGNHWSSYHKTGVKLEHLKAPKKLVLSNKKAGIYVDWDKSTGASKYIVYRKKEGGNYIEIAATKNTSYYDKSATKKGKKYSYKVLAYSNGGKSVASVTKTIYR